MSKRPPVIEIDEQLLLPGAVRDGKMKLAKHSICACGLADSTVGDVTIDGRIALVQPHPQSTLYLCPLAPNPYPSYGKAWFYSDCIAFEHEIPCVVYPQDSEFNSFRYSFVHSGPTRPQKHEIHHTDSNTRETFVVPPAEPSAVSRRHFMDQLLMILGLVHEQRYGPFTYVLFRTYQETEETDLPYTKMYGSLEKEISLYASALRQGDFLSEYLGYYRVLESVTENNGKKWLASALPRLRQHAFGKVLVGHSRDYESPPRNALGVFRRRALLRYRSLLKRFGNDDAIARYLYNVNRCGIAHGKDSIVKGHVTPMYFEVGRDALLVKLLAKMAIQEKMG